MDESPHDESARPADDSAGAAAVAPPPGPSSTPTDHLGLLDDANDIIYTHDLQGNFLYVNKAGVETYGYSRAELEAMNIAQIVDPESLQLAIENITRKMSGAERTEPYEVLTRTHDGAPVYVEVSTRLVRDDAGTALYVQGIARNVGERKRVERELEEGREALRATIESTADGILAVGADGRVLHANRRFLELWRIPQSLADEQDDEKLIAFALEQLDDPDAFLSRVRELYESGDEDFDTLRFKDGRVYERYSRPLRSGDGDGIVGRVWSFRDITERSQAEATLQESERLYRQLFQRHSAVQVLIDPNTRVVVEPNAAACAFYGYERESFIGMEVSRIDAPLPDDDRPELVREATQRRGIFSRRHTLASGEVRDVDVYLGPVELQGRELLLVIVQDVTERRRAERDLADHQRQLEEKSSLLEVALASERERARRDALTNTLNHAAIADTLRAAIAGTEQSLSVAMVDVNDLKAVNDTYGHQMGDAALMAVAGALQREGAIVGRFGGDEFLVVLPGAGRGSAERYREEVATALAGAYLTDAQTGAHVPVVASVGLAVYPEEAQAFEDLIEASDNAMYAVKRQRAARPATGVDSRLLASDRAAKMVGEIVPFLTSSGSLDEKLRLVAERLTTGAGYAGVSWALFREDEDRRIGPQLLRGGAERAGREVGRDRTRTSRWRTSRCARCWRAPSGR